MQQELQTVLMLLHDAELNVNIGVKADAPLYEDELLIRLMHNIVREHVFEEDAYAMWSDGLFPLTALEEAAASGEAYFARLNGPGEPFEEYTGDAAAEQAAKCFKDAPIDAQVSIEIIDSTTGETVAVRHF